MRDDRSLKDLFIEQGKDEEEASEDAPTVLMTPEALAAELKGSLSEATLETPGPAPAVARPAPVAPPPRPEAPSISPAPLQARAPVAPTPAPAAPSPEAEGPPWGLVAGGLALAVLLLAGLGWWMTQA